MAKYYVHVPELHYQKYAVEAESFDEAAHLVYRWGKGYAVGEPVFQRSLRTEDGFKDLLVEDVDTADERYVRDVAELAAEFDGKKED